MALYSLGVRTTAGTTGAAAWEIRSTSTDRLFVVEIGVFLAAATASTYGLGRPAAIGVTPTSPVATQAEDPANPAATALSALAWGTGPTVPTNFLRRVSFPATIGSGVIWTFPKGLIIPVSSSIVLWNAATNGVVDAYCVIDE